jgi:hypothetical protein
VRNLRFELHLVSHIVRVSRISTPSIASLKKAIQTYARQGGTSSIFINDDGLRVMLHIH